MSKTYSTSFDNSQEDPVNYNFEYKSSLLPIKNMFEIKEV